MQYDCFFLCDVFYHRQIIFIIEMKLFVEQNQHCFNNIWDQHAFPTLQSANIVFCERVTGRILVFRSTCGQCSQCSHALPSFLLLTGLLLGSKQYRGSMHERMRARFSVSFVWLTYKLFLKCQGLKTINLSCHVNLDYSQ